MARSISRALSEPFIVQGHAIGISASVGIALFPTHASDVASLLQHADRAMYQAKSGMRAGIDPEHPVPNGPSPTH